MPLVVTYTKILRVENLNVWMDENSEIKVNMNVRIATENGQTDRRSKIFDLAPGVQTMIEDFVKARVQELGTEWNVDIPAWAQP